MTNLIAPSVGGLPRAVARMIAVVATTVLLFVVAAVLPAAGPTGAGVLSTATSAVAPSQAHAFFRVPSGFTRWLEFQSRKQRPYCFAGPCADPEWA